MISSTASGISDEISKKAVKGVPFLFVINYDLSSAITLNLSECEAEGVLFDIEGVKNCSKVQNKEKIHLNQQPVIFSEYLKSFKYVQEEIHKGNSYLVNLTFPTPVSTNFDLRKIFDSATAPYKLLFKDQFLVFSPECFVKINSGKIFSFPMKGTIDASLQNAAEILLQNEKETAEHATIVDLIRNDLSKVASNVQVEKYRYIERINTSSKSLLQMSSLVSGDLPINWKSRLGEILTGLLPAGSICGAPKKATLEIIAKAEKYNRGFYTGVFGIFDGESVNCGVMIRFIENQNGSLIYKSGGGITAMSKAEVEYQELRDKIYVPVN